METILQLSKNLHAKKVQRLFDTSEDYFLEFELRYPTANEAERFFLAVPDGVQLQDKYTFGIFSNSRLVGVIDWIRGYPNAKSVYLGFLLVNPKYRNKRIATSLYEKSFQMIAPHKDKKVSLCVEEQNTAAILFWENIGFKKTKRFTKDVNGFLVSFFTMTKAPISRDLITPSSLYM